MHTHSCAPLVLDWLRSLETFDGWNICTLFLHCISDLHFQTQRCSLFIFHNLVCLVCFQKKITILCVWCSPIALLIPGHQSQNHHTYNLKGNRSSMVLLPALSHWYGDPNSCITDLSATVATTEDIPVQPRKPALWTLLLKPSNSPILWWPEDQAIDGILSSVMLYSSYLIFLNCHETSSRD